VSIGQELLNVPFPQMVQSLAESISKGQMALDKTSLATARTLAQEKVAVIQQVQETIWPDVRQIALPAPTDEDGNPIKDENGENIPGRSIMVTGARAEFLSQKPEEMTLLQAGLTPTFYQFTETIIEVKMAISTRTSSSSEIEAGASLGINYGPVSFAAHVNYKSSQTYSYSAEGSSLLRTTLKPVPPPSRLTPRILTINTLPMLQGQPAVITNA